MSFEHTLRRLNPFEGLCLTAQDLEDDQLYHRRALHRHALFLHGFGVVQGLQVELEQRKKKYTAVVKAGYGITREGQGVHLKQDVIVPLEVPKQDGEYLLWLFHVERPDADAAAPGVRHRPTCARRGSWKRSRRACCRPTRSTPTAVALSRINVRLGRMVPGPAPGAARRPPDPRGRVVPQAAGAGVRPGEPEDHHEPVPHRHRSRSSRSGSSRTSASLISAEFLLIEEGTGDRVLYRTAGTLITFAHDFYNPLPPTTDRVAQFTEFVRRVNAGDPGRRSVRRDLAEVVPAVRAAAPAAAADQRGAREDRRGDAVGDFTPPRSLQPARRQLALLADRGPVLAVELRVAAAAGVRLAERRPFAQRSRLARVLEALDRIGLRRRTRPRRSPRRTPTASGGTADRRGVSSVSRGCSRTG